MFEQIMLILALELGIAVALACIEFLTFVAVGVIPIR